MDFLVLWTSLALIATAIVLSLMLWRKQRDHRVLLLTALLLAIGIRFGLLTSSRLFDVTVTGIATWVQLFTAALGVAAVGALDRLLTTEGKRREAISRVQAVLNEAEGGLTQEIGWQFFRRAMHSLTEILEVDYAFIGELSDDGQSINVLALSHRGKDGELFSYKLAGTPCENVSSQKPSFYARNIAAHFPDDKELVDLSIEAYLGVPLFGAEERPLGLMVVMHTAPRDDSATMMPAMRILGARASAELEREQQNRRLRESEQRYRALFDDSVDARFVTDAAGRMVDINAAGVELFGYASREELLANFNAEKHYTATTDRATVLEDLDRRGRLRDYPVEIRRLDGSVVSALEGAVAERDAEGNITVVRGTLRDVTRERELQRQLMSSQRMEAVGRMAGGVAHDFNNMLTVINGHSDLLLEELDPDSPTASDVREIKSAVESAAAFTRRLLLLSRRKVLAPERVDLNRVMRDLSRLLQKAVGEDVVMKLELQHDLGDVIADATEMEQVLLNLVINARDAMPAGGGLTIGSRRLTLGTQEATARGLEPGTWVELSVADEGIGIDPDVADHIFEPFFTTKDPTIGTGLGLSTVYGIIRQLGGDITVESTPGQGTTFSMLIPAAPAEEESVPVIATSSKKKPSETLLVVDDEPAVRNLLRQFLERQGYAVRLAADGSEALASLKNQGRVDLLISDMMMPGLRGDRLAALGREVQEDLRVLLISGNNHSGDTALNGGAPAAFLGKPFSTRELAERVRELLDR